MPLSRFDRLILSDLAESIWNRYNLSLKNAFNYFQCSNYTILGIASNSLANLTSLKEFNVNGGIIGPLTSDSFAGLDSLQTLILNGDFLETTLPSGLFTGHPLLEEIDLQTAGITSIPADTFTGLDQLSTLDLRENGLTTLPEGLFQSLTSLTTVELGTNAWNCTCDLAWLATWSLYTGVSIDVDCSSPSQFVGTTLSRAVASLGCLDSVRIVFFTLLHFK